MLRQNKGKEKENERLPLLNSANEDNYTELAPNPFSLLPDELVAKILLEAAGYRSSHLLSKDTTKNLISLAHIDKHFYKAIQNTYVSQSQDEEIQFGDLLPKLSQLALSLKDISSAQENIKSSFTYKEMIETQKTGAPYYKGGRSHNRFILAYSIPSIAVYSLALLLLMYLLFDVDKQPSLFMLLCITIVPMLSALLTCCGVNKLAPVISNSLFKAGMKKKALLEELAKEKEALIQHTLTG